jgi:hypothetical protein
MTLKEKPGRDTSLPNGQERANLLTSEQKRIKKLSPLEVAIEFAQTCIALDSFYEEEPAQMPYLERIELAGRQRSILQGLDDLVSIHYAGTQMGMSTLIESLHPVNATSSQALRDSSYRYLLSQLDIDIDANEPGVFTKEGAKEYEKTTLRFILPARIATLIDSVELYKGYQRLQDDTLDLIGKFLIQVNQYQELFGESYDGGGESIIVKRLELKKYLEERTPTTVFTETEISPPEIATHPSFGFRRAPGSPMGVRGNVIRPPRSTYSRR